MWLKCHFNAISPPKNQPNRRPVRKKTYTFRSKNLHNPFRRLYVNRTNRLTGFLLKNCFSQIIKIVFNLFTKAYYSYWSENKFFCPTEPNKYIQ